MSRVIALIAIFALVDRSIPSLTRYYYRHTYNPLNVKNGAEFEECIRDATYELIASESWGTRPMASCMSFSHFYYKKIFDGNNVIGYGEYGYLLHYAFLYAKKKNDQEMMSLIKDKFDKSWLKDLPIERIDQAAYGNVAIDLYLETHKPEYKSVADRFIAHLDSLYSNNGAIRYFSDSFDQDVDAIGLVPPFLFYYSKTFNNTKAQMLASHMVEDFVKWGTDPITGIPCQAYDTKTHVKKRHVNWGRGTSWYLLGVRHLESIDSVINERVELLDSTLIKMDTYLYPQYLGENGKPDMSVTIPILHYLNSKGRMSLSKDELANILSPYIDEEGIIRYGSPSISRPHEGVSVQMTNLMAQGLLLYYISEL